MTHISVYRRRISPSVLSSDRSGLLGYEAIVGGKTRCLFSVLKECDKTYRVSSDHIVSHEEDGKIVTVWRCPVTSVGVDVEEMVKRLIQGIFLIASGEVPDVDFYED